MGWFDGRSKSGQPRQAPYPWRQSHDRKFIGLKHELSRTQSEANAKARAFCFHPARTREVNVKDLPPLTISGRHAPASADTATADFSVVVSGGRVSRWVLNIVVVVGAMN